MHHRIYPHQTQDAFNSLDAHFIRMIKFTQQFITTHVENQVFKIKTPRALGFALAHTGWGEAQNVVVQVMNTNVEHKC